MLGLGGGGNQIWSGIPKVQGYFWPQSGGGGSLPLKNANFPKVPLNCDKVSAKSTSPPLFESLKKEPFECDNKGIY